jgi:hypothetical protein
MFTITNDQYDTVKAAFNPMDTAILCNEREADVLQESITYFASCYGQEGLAYHR